jgi:bis(5'-nucleosyl)-tetraphosphatase (symmetrical)
MSRLVVYGDIHGCLESLITLREKIQPSSLDIELCVGDFLTKGNKSVETLRYIMGNSIKTVVGNHEDRIIRFLKHRVHSTINPVTLDDDELNIVAQLNTQDINFLLSLPHFIKLDAVTVLHAGLRNHIQLDAMSKRDKEEIIRLRYLDQDQRFVILGKETQNSVFWADVYDGKQGFVIYGHQVFSEIKTSEHAIGIDTGCYLGNKLSALVIDSINPKNYRIFDVSCKNKLESST